MTTPSKGELFIVDNSDAEWKVQRYLKEWTGISSSFDIATGHFEIGGLLALDGDWQKLDKIRILMGDQVLTENIELNIQIRREVEQLQAWFEHYWAGAREVTVELLKVVERQIQEYPLHCLRESAL